MNFDEAQEVIRNYGEALKRSSAEVGLNPLFPEDSLPHPRELIKEAIRLVYARTDDYETRRFLLDSYVKLAAFVPNRRVEEVALWLRAGISGDKSMESQHHESAVSILSYSLELMENLRSELLQVAD